MDEISWLEIHCVISELFESVCLRCPLLKTDGQKRPGLLRVGSCEIMM